MTFLRALGSALLVVCVVHVHAAPSSHAAIPITHHVPAADSEIVVDGVLDEPAWSEALILDLDFEVEPGENIPPPVRTEVLITYDDRRIYFGFRAHDPDPSRIRARFSDRDRAWNDDWVGVAIDTFNDERRAYELLVNPLGVQMDAINDDVQREYDDSWNAIWYSAGRVTDQGYTVEMSVPFNQIRFQAVGDDPQTWGFDAFRSYPRSDRHHIGLFPRERGSNSYLSQTVKLEGMAGASPGKNLELIPTLTASRTDLREDVPSGELEEGDVDPELGATVRWGVTPNVSLNAAVNPDFSQVEADVLRLSINEQFTLFFPETRPFFLEGADYFNTPLNLVYTRVVADPDFAGKVTGKQGRSTFGVFSARDALTNMLYPGPQGSSTGSYDFETLNTVARYRFDFGRNSTVGATLTDRRGDEYFNTVAGIDATYRITDADTINASYSASSMRYDDAMILDAEVQEGTFDDSALLFDYLHSKRNWWIDVTHNDIGDGFRADSGFLPQVDVVDTRLAGAKIWWGEPEDFHNRLAWGGAVQHRERQNGELLNEEIETWVNLNGPMQSFATVNLSFGNRIFDGVRFEDQLFAHTLLELQATRNLHLGFHQDYGDWIDFANTRPAKRSLFQPRVRYNLGRHLLLQYNHTYSALDVEGGRLFRAHAPELRAVYQFNTRAYVRAILQYTDIKRDPSLYLDEVPERSKDFFTQLLFTYKVNPQTAVYVGYSGESVASEAFEMTPVGRSFFVKLSYAWVP